jgi:DNA-binding PadR family transcriptional regulator
MMSTKTELGKLEQEAMLVILELGDKAYAPSIARELEAAGGRGISRGALYMSFERLSRLGLVRWFIEGPSPDRGGYPKRRFELTAAGIEVLKVEWETPLHLRARLEEILAREER